jgi:hypothetical protein
MIQSALIALLLSVGAFIAFIRMCHVALSNFNRHVPFPASRPLFQFLDVIDWPGAIKICFRRRVQAEVSEPVLAFVGLDPIRFFSGRSLGAKVEINGAIRDRKSVV